MLETIVIGGGIAGFATALALWEHEAAVTVVEASRPGAEATGASAGMLAAQYEAGGAGPRLRLCLESRTRYPRFVERLEELSGHALQIRWDGLLVANLTAAEHRAAEDAVAWQRSLGLAAELIGPGEATGLQPGVATDLESYIWLPSEGQVDSQRLAAAMGDAIARTGIRLISGNRVAGILVEEGAADGVRMVDGRRLEGDAVVVAAGAWSDQLEGLPRRLPVRPVRGQMLRFSTGTLALRRIIASHAGRYVVPRTDETTLAGSTMEEVGFDRSITEEGLQGVHDAAARLVPALRNLRPLERWAGLRPISADGSPIIGPDPDLRGLFYATGYGRDGILMAPLAGAAVADLLVKGVSEIDWRPFGPGRFDVVRNEGR